MSTLVLVPTGLERARLLPHLTRDPGVELCGFGPVAAAATAARLLAERRPERVALVGIAGTYDGTALPVGTACAFERVVLVGLGVESRDAALGPRELGLPQLEADGGRGPVFDELPLWLPATGVAAARELVTAPTASADPEQAARRRSRRPAAAAEDMEAFGVALAARAAGVPLLVVRGLSNAVGDRDHDRWQVDRALAAAAALLDRALATDWVVGQDGRP